MQFDFFPSRTLTLYLAKMFVVRILAVLVMLVLVLLMLDLLSSTGKILKVPGNGQAEIWTYATLRMPQLVARFLPYSVLLATIITLVGLNQNSEVIAMKAAGMSAHQVLAPLILTALLVAVGSFAFNERVVTRATATLKAWDANEFRAVPKDSGVRANVYIAQESDILAAGSVTGSGNATELGNVTWYRRAPSGAIAEQVRAPEAVWTGKGWRMTDATRFEIAGARSSTVDEITVAPSITPEQVWLGSVDPDAQSFWELGRSIDEYEAAGRRTAEIRSKWWHKLAGPLSSVLMPLLGAVAAFGLARSGQLFVRAVIGMALGFAYFVVDNAALAMGNFGGYPPLLAAWAPFVLFALIGETVLVRTEE